MIYILTLVLFGLIIFLQRKALKEIKNKYYFLLFIAVSPLVLLFVYFVYPDPSVQLYGVHEMVDLGFRLACGFFLIENI